jgi:hypothetical protein
MSTNLLYHAFKMRGYCHRRTDYPKGPLVFTIWQWLSAYPKPTPITSPS